MCTQTLQLNCYAHFTEMICVDKRQLVVKTKNRSWLLILSENGKKFSNNKNVNLLTHTHTHISIDKWHFVHVFLFFSLSFSLLHLPIDSEQIPCFLVCSVFLIGTKL